MDLGSLLTPGQLWPGWATFADDMLTLAGYKYTVLQNMQIKLVIHREIVSIHPYLLEAQGLCANLPDRLETHAGMLSMCTWVHSDIDSSRIPTKVSEMADLPAGGAVCTQESQKGSGTTQMHQTHAHRCRVLRLTCKHIRNGHKPQKWPQKSQTYLVEAQDGTQRSKEA